MKILIFLTFIFSYLPAFSSLQIGKKAPSFSLKTWDNSKQVSLSDYKNQIVVIEWFSTQCPFSKRHARSKTMSSLYQKYQSKNVVWIGIDSTDPKMNDNLFLYGQWLSSNGITYPILKDESGIIGKLYQAKVTPQMFIVNKGVLVYQGAIDNDTFGDLEIQKRINYVDLALQGLTTKGKLPKKLNAKTHPYGCGIKYQKL